MTDSAPQWWLKAICEFGAGMGFRDTSGWRSEVLNLSVEDGKYVIDVERWGDEIVLAVLCHTPLPEVEEKALLLLAGCDVENYRPFFLQVGLKGEDIIVLAARVGRSQAHRMIDAFETIRGLYAQTGL